MDNIKELLAGLNNGKILVNYGLNSRFTPSYFWIGSNNDIYCYNKHVGLCKHPKTKQYLIKAWCRHLNKNYNFGLLDTLPDNAKKALNKGMI